MGGTPRKDFLAFLVWAAHRRLLEEPIIIHETVRHFDVGHLERCLGDRYAISTSLLNVAAYGPPSTRIRRITFVCHKDIMVEPPAPLPSWEECAIMFKRDCETDWSVCQVASEKKLESEFAWAASRPTTRMTLVPDDQKDGATPNNSRDFVAALNHHEFENYLKYRKICPDGLASLHQNADKHCTTNRGRPQVHTLIKNPGTVFSMKHQRWLTPSEWLVIMNFPVSAHLSANGESCSLERGRDPFGFPPPRRMAMLQQAGHSFNPVVVGVAIFRGLVIRDCSKNMALAALAATSCAALRRRLLKHASSGNRGSAASAPTPPPSPRGSKRPFQE